MYCPECKAEYREGFTSCSDCQIPLVSELPDDAKVGQKGDLEGYIKFEPVLATHNQGDIAIIKSILDNENIQYHFKDEAMNLVRPHLEPAILMAQDDQVETVRHLFKDLDLQITLWGKG